MQAMLTTPFKRIFSEEASRWISRDFSFKEMELAVMEANSDTAPGPDGFHYFFYQKCWDIVKSDLWGAVKYISNGGQPCLRNQPYLHLSNP